MNREFTGRHMLFVMCAMFGTIIAVNLVMARFAVTTFGGVVVENSYVASQNFNGWLGDARAQEALGWTLDVTRDAQGRLEARTAVEGATITAVAQHPVGRAAEQTLRFTSVAPGVWRSTTALPEGRWKVRFVVQQGATEARFIRDLAK
jgi:nitrogen fixation protein FixH